MRDFILDHLYGVVVFALIVVVIFVCSIPAMHVENYTVEITKTEITGGDDYMVFGKDSMGQTKTFTLNDSFWHGSWNTADMYAQLEVGQTYQFRATGWRIPFLSAFPNIIDITKVS